MQNVFLTVAWKLIGRNTYVQNVRKRHLSQTGARLVDINVFYVEIQNRMNWNIHVMDVPTYGKKLI